MGIIDSDNHQKPAYYYLKRAWSPIRLALLDRGLDGLVLEVHNESPEPIVGHLEVAYGRNRQSNRKRPSSCTYLREAQLADRWKLCSTTSLTRLTPTDSAHHATWQSSLG